MASTLLSMVFYITLVIYFYAGMHAYYLNPKNRINGLFFYLCIAAGIWSFSYSLMNHAMTLEGAHYSYILSISGWGVFYSLLLHFIIRFANPDLKLRSRHMAGIYLPVPITYGLFLYAERRGQLIERIVIGENSWVIQRAELFMDSWMKLYFMLFMLLSFYFLIRGHKETKDQINKREIRLIFAVLGGSFIIALFQLFGSSESFAWKYFFIGSNKHFLTIVAIYAILWYRARRSRSEIASLPDRGAYLSAKTHEKIFFYISQAYILAAFLSFGIEVLINNVQIWRSSVLSLIMFAIGFVIFFLHKAKKNIKLRDNIIFSVMSVTIPLITLYQIKAAATFAWTVPVVFVLVAVAFNNTKLLTSTSLITMSTLIVLWLVKPEATADFKGGDHFARIMVFIIIIALAYLINSIYKNRLNQFERQIDHERFVAEMSIILSVARNKNMRSNLDIFLEKSVKYMDAEYGSIHIFSDKEKKIKKIEGYGRYDLVGIKNNWFFSKEIDHLMKRLAGGHLTEDQFVNELETFRQMMDGKGVVVMITPLQESGKILGVMCLGSSRSRKLWDEGYFNTYHLIGSSLSSMLYKIKNEDDLYRMAYYDALTGLPNRVLFDKIVNKLIAEIKENEMFAMIFLDLDDFKNINDLMGHSVGDAFLVELARRIKPKLKKENHMSRLGGDEFLIILPDVKSVDEIRTFAEEILREIATPLKVDERETTTGGSLGISIFPQDGDNAEELIKYADLAMYISKSSSKNRYTICTDDIKSHFIMEKELENDLYKAMVKNEFVLYYQPKVHGATEEICGMEALIRWDHPVKGMIPPGLFLPIAERIGIMPQIDDWVFMEACDQNLKWQDMGYEKIGMSINITPISLMDNDFDVDLNDVFKRRRWDPEYIEVEVTEDTMYLSVESIQRNLKKMRDTGITISLDDFGTAYSSLSRLHILPIDKIKIDRQFIINLSEGGKNLYDGILNLTKSLGLAVTVEGVETKQQADYVRGLGCDEIQGYYYHKPMPSEEVEKLLKRRYEERLS